MQNWYLKLFGLLAYQSVIMTCYNFPNLRTWSTAERQGRTSGHCPHGLSLLYETPNKSPKCFANSPLWSGRSPRLWNRTVSICSSHFYERLGTLLVKNRDKFTSSRSPWCVLDGARLSPNIIKSLIKLRWIDILIYHHQNTLTYLLKSS